MENTSSITDSIIQTINTIFEKLFGSVDNTLFSIIDKITLEELMVLMIKGERQC